MKELIKLTGIVWIPFTLSYLFRNEGVVIIVGMTIIGFIIGLIMLFNTNWMKSEQQPLDFWFPKHNSDFTEIKESPKVCFICEGHKYYYLPTKELIDCPKCKGKPS